MLKAFQQRTTAERSAIDQFPPHLPQTVMLPLIAYCSNFLPVILAILFPRMLVEMTFSGNKTFRLVNIGRRELERNA
jgi:hypothetical protein